MGSYNFNDKSHTDWNEDDLTGQTSNLNSANGNFVSDKMAAFDKSATSKQSNKIADDENVVLHASDASVAAKDRAKQLASFIVGHHALDVKPRNKYEETLRRTCGELLEKHKILFKGMINKLESTPQNGRSPLVKVLDEMLSDEKINWGRVVAAYSLMAALGKHCAQNQRFNLLPQIISEGGEYVATKMVPWILSQGGWEAFLDFFSNGSSSMMTGFVMAALGIGAVLTASILVR